MNPFRITSLEAHQIGPFGDLKMTFPEKPAGMEDKAEVHILTGENGTGKSTVLEMIVSAIGGSDINPEKCRNKPTNEIRLKVDSTYGILRNNHPNSDPKVRLIPGGYASHGAEFGPASKVAFAYSGFRRFGKVIISSIHEIDSHPLENALDFQNSINAKDILQWIANNIAKEALAKSQNDLIGAKRFQVSISQLEDVISSIIEKPVKFVFEYNPMAILIEVNHERLDFNLLPDGLNSIISWLADLLMRMDRVKWVDDIPVFERNFILFLDEIEVHMHPRWQRKILPAVQGLFPNAQIFISTHSPFVINSVDGAWIHRLVKPNGDSVALEPVLSEDGKSINQVLEEIFDVTERFGVGVEADLKAFYEVRNRLIKNGSSNGKEEEELKQIAKKLQGQSTTLDQIVAMEIRQLNRIKQLEINV
ncbi:MAG: AAA family ATPase [Saprospiraceae bacterium]|nr:AAA family ATPase [Saprospiraceae bacterium]